MKTCAEIIKGLREDKDLTQSQMAKHINTSQQQYSNYETGESDPPLKSLLLLSAFHQVSLDYLVGKTDCKEGIDALGKKVCQNYSVGALVSDVLSLGEKGRLSVIDYVDLQKLRKQYSTKK